MKKRGEKTVKWQKPERGRGGGGMERDGGVQEYECACIFKAVFLLQEHTHAHARTHARTVA